MITRTFITYKVTATLVDKSTKEIAQDTITIPASSFNKKDAEKSVKKFVPAGKLLITVDNYETIEELRGITEELFLANSTIVTRPASQQKKSDATVNA